MKQISAWFAIAGVVACLSAPISLCAEDNSPIRIMPVGDSITYGVGGTDGLGGYRGKLHTLLTGAGYSVDFVGTSTGNGEALPDPEHDGHRGWRIDEVHDHIDTWLGLIGEPDILLLHIGTNDFTQYHETPTAIDRLDALIDKITTLAPSTHVIVTNLLERKTSRDRLIRSEFNPFVPDVVASYVAENKRVSYLDLRATVPFSDLPDEVHPNQTGYDKMAAAWFGAIVQIIDAPPALPTSVVHHIESHTDRRTTRGVDLVFSNDVSQTDLLHGLPGIYSGWQQTDSFSPANLNDGLHGPTSVGTAPNAIAFAADTGSSATFFLGNGDFGRGFDISSIVSIAAWRDASLFQQHYEIWIRKTGETEFTKLYTVPNDFEPMGNLDLGGSTKITTIPAETAFLARGVDAIRFLPLDIPSSYEPSPGGGGTAFREIDVFGSPTPANTTSFQTWANSHGIAPNPQGDSDGDGIVDLMEYALGLNPHESDRPTATLAGNQISYMKNAEAAAAGDITYTIEISETLQPNSWTRVTPDTNNGSQITYALPEDKARVFARLVVRQTP